jgi:hypothetical protein
MTHTLVGRGRRSVRHEEAVLDIVHGNPSTSTYRHISSAAGRLSQRAVRRTVHDNKLTVSCTTRVRFAAGNKHVRVEFSR